MTDLIDLQLIALLQQGLPLVSRPYAVIAEQLKLNEDQVLKRLSTLKQQGVIKRLGVIVNHRRLGYNANAMVVFDVHDALVEQIGEHISQFSFVNLCYQRPRHGEKWPYNLYCMIHGKNREKVLQQLAYLTESCGLGQFKSEVLFSKQCFKQRGALYRVNAEQEKIATDG
jgi:DNA-binding Lrp family transcriptional regulator